MMTFAICLFIVLMQFLWQYIEDMVGKGLEVYVLMELFFYAALSLVHLALPLAVLLASIMVFGGLGESLELLAVKAAGIPLLKMMRPLIICVIIISIGAFLYEDRVSPRIQGEFLSLLLSVRTADPALDIPEGVFYRDIPDINIYMGRRDHRTGMMHNVWIYDLAQGFHNMAVIVADSARMSVTEDQTMLVFTLYSGQQFRVFGQDSRNQRRRQADDLVPYARESFAMKTILIPHDINFDRMTAEQIEDGSHLRHHTLNLAELSVAIDSMSHIVDSINVVDRQIMRNTAFFTHRHNFPYHNRDSIIRYTNFEDIQIPSAESLAAERDIYTQALILQTAITRTEQNRNEFLFRSVGNKAAMQRLINRHWAEWHRKFTRPFTVLIFFFIGAPLGAIVRKGGIGMPIVMSVVMFIFYYILDNIGFQMTRDGVWVHWFGMWFSSIVLLPLGVFLTWKAMNDSTIMNVDTYLTFFRKLFFIREKRFYPVKQVIIENPNYETIPAELTKLANEIDAYLQKYNRLTYKTYWTDTEYEKELRNIKSNIEIVLNQISNSTKYNELNKAEEFPILIDYVRPFAPNSRMARLMMMLFPIGFFFQLISKPFEMRISTDLKNTQRLCGEMQDVIRENELT